MTYPFPGLETLATGATWGERPVCLEDFAALWSDMPGSRVLRWHPQDCTPETPFSVLMRLTRLHKGHSCDDQGRLRRILRAPKAATSGQVAARTSPLVL